MLWSDKKYIQEILQFVAYDFKDCILDYNKIKEIVDILENINILIYNKV